MLQQVLSLEADFLLWIQNNVRTDWMNPIWIGITKLGDGGIIWIAGALILLIPKKTRRIGICCLIALMGSLLINNVILKNLVARTRPYDAIAGLSSLIGSQSDFSFPSGHTGSSFAAATVMFCGLKKRYGSFALILAALIGFSRIYVGVHYPSDVIGGALIGAIIGYMVYTVGLLFGNKSSQET